MGSSINMTNLTITNHTTAHHTINPQLQLIIFINVHVLLAQILFGVTGNFMNLIVLLNRTMRSRTNLIFAAMAFADLFLLLFQLHQVLFFSGFLMDNIWYRTHVHWFVAPSNWLSAVSIWCMTYATIERVQVFRSPFRTSKRTVSPRFLCSLSFIVVGAFLLTFINWFPAKTRQQFWLTPYISLANTLLVVFIPLLICATLNILLIVALKRNTMPIAMLNDSSTQQSLIIARNKRERKVTVMVTIIISSFIVCNAPGAIITLLININKSIFDPKSIQFSLVTTISNSLAVTGKVLNFVLFCLSSEHFRALLRRRILSLAGRWRKKQSRRNTFSTATKTYSMPLYDL